MGDAELREVVAARLGVNGEAILQNLINTGKAELIMVGDEGNEVAFVRIKSYQWRNETGLRCDQTIQGVQKNLEGIDLGDLVQQTMDTICDIEDTTVGSNSIYAPLALTDPRLLQNNATSMEVHRQFHSSGDLTDFFIYIYIYIYIYKEVSCQ